MLDREGILFPEDEMSDIATAIRSLRARIQWKVGKDARHLEKRKQRGHLPAEFTAEQYNNLITAILSDDQNLVYSYQVAGTMYGVVRGTYEGQEWLVIFGLDGVMETAFPPKRPEQYVTRHGFVFLGKAKEVLKWAS